MSKELFMEFDTLSKKGVLSEQEKRRFDFLKKTLPSGTINPTEKYSTEDRSAAIVAKYEQRFAEYVSGKLTEENFRKMIDAGEFRSDDQQFGGWGRPVAPLTYIGGDLQGGTGSGVAGGFAVPPSFYKTAINSTKQFSELLNEDNVRLVTEPSYGMPGRTFVGFDFSTFQAGRAAAYQFGNTYGDVTQITNVQDGITGNAASIPPAYAKMLTSTIYAVTLRVDMSLDNDSMVGLDGGILGALAEGFGEGFGRRVGTDLVNGTGQANGQPSGIVTGAASAGISAALSYDTLKDIYFSVDRAYRNSPKCRWLMSDGTYKAIRSLTTNITGSDKTPFIRLDEDGEKLFGKKILIAPDMPTFNASPSVTGQILFGDFSHYLVRCSQMWIQRNTNRYADFGEVGLLARLRVDGIVFDPSGGVTAPIKKAAIVG